MKPLLRIENVPIKVEFKTSQAKMEMKQPNAEVKVSRDRGKLTIQSNPIKLKLDTFESRASAGLKSTPRLVSESAQEGIKAAYEVTARTMDEGRMMLDIHIKNNPLPDIAYQRMTQNLDTNIEFLPSTGPEINWEGGDMSIEFQMDKLNLDWNTNQNAEFTFIPGDIEFVIAEYPKVVIEYIGDPIYVPPSSNPNYTGQKFDVTA